MGTVRRHLYGAHPRRAVGTVIAVGTTAAAFLIPLGLLEIGVSGWLGTSAFAMVFGPLPGLAGGICGWYRLGYPAAAASGVTPGVAFYLVVAVGAALDVGGFGGGDSPLAPFAITLAAPGFVLATTGFVLAATVAILLERRQ